MYYCFVSDQLHSVIGHPSVTAHPVIHQSLMTKVHEIERSQRQLKIDIPLPPLDVNRLAVLLSTNTDVKRSVVTLCIIYYIIQISLKLGHPFQLISNNLALFFTGNLQ